MILLAIAFAFASCEHEIVSDATFSVTLDTSNTYKAGEPVVFHIIGEPDNVLFYSGESGAVYGEAGATGAVIKNIQNYMHTYEYVWNQPGTYTVTFHGSCVTYISDSQHDYSLQVIILENLDQ